MTPFLTAPNLASPALAEGFPWDFASSDATLKKLPKVERRKRMLHPKTQWNVYSSVRGFAPNQRVSKENPPAALRGIVIDYDAVSTIDAVCGYLTPMSEALRPQKIETTLGNKIRLVWIFEREILVPSTEFCCTLLASFADKLGLRTLLPGFDDASLKPTEMWTNGGIWHDLNPAPLAWEFIFGVYCEVSKKASLFNKGEVPLEMIKKEVEKRFAGRWQGDFQLDALGVRFWAEAADNETGCQVKPDGMLCFTGKVPFVKWAEIFGTAWVEEQRVLNLGRAGSGFYFDEKDYWEERGGVWGKLSRVDTILRLKNSGLSDRTGKGVTVSDVDRVLNHIQLANTIEGAAPLINYKPGLVNLQGRRILNTIKLDTAQPVAGATGDVTKDCPTIWGILSTFLARPEGRPLMYLLAWARRHHRNMLYHENSMGQAIFIAGPKNSAKTLVMLKVLAPLFGNRWENPINYFTGVTTFNSELFASPFLCVNDEDGPGSEAVKNKMAQKLKSTVVNPTHSYHAKFSKPVNIEWTGRVAFSLNNDPASLAILPEVNANTADKLMFFASQVPAMPFPERRELEAALTKELPAFSHWLLNVFQAEADILTSDRFGVKSYFDPLILEHANQQSYSHNLRELLTKWIQCASYWGEDNKNTSWTGNPTDLLAELHGCDSVEVLSREWNIFRLAKALTGLSRVEGSGVTASGLGREFTITK